MHKNHDKSVKKVGQLEERSSVWIMDEVLSWRYNAKQFIIIANSMVL